MSISSLRMSDMQTGITGPADECVAHPSSWQEKPCWLIACLCWREHRFRGLLKKQKWEPQNIHSLWKKACQVFGVYLRLFYKPPHPHPPRSPCLCLHCSHIMLPESNLTSGVKSLSSLLAIIHHSHQLSWNINWKGKKAISHFLAYQFDFRRR